MSILIITNFLSSTTAIYSSIKYPFVFQLLFNKYNTKFFFWYFGKFFYISSVCCVSILTKLFLISLNIRISLLNKKRSIRKRNIIFFFYLYLLLYSLFIPIDMVLLKFIVL